MKYFIDEVKNWLLKDEIPSIEREDDDHDNDDKEEEVIEFYTRLFQLTSHTEYIDDIPTAQHIFDDFTNNNYVNDEIFENFRKKILFYINFLKSKAYLEIIPRLAVVHNRIMCVDHLLINKNQAPLSPDDLIMQSINESIGHAKSLLMNDYHIDDEFLFKSLNNKDPLFVLFLPYYYLMEKLRTHLDPNLDNQNFKTIRRDKQYFLDRVYQGLADKKILVYNSSTPDLQRLNKYFRYGWIKPTSENPGLVQHYYYIFRLLVKEYLLNSHSIFYYENIEDNEFHELIKDLDENLYNTSLNAISKIVRIFLQHSQKLLLTNNKEIDGHSDYRFVRNIAVELILQDSTVKELESKSGEIAHKDKFEFYEIMVHYHDRASDVLSSQIMKLENLKEVLMDPVNSNIFFNNTGKFESSIHSFEDLLKKYNKNKNHLMSIFPDLGNIPKEREQLKLIMNSFKRIGYVVHIALPAHDCKEVKYDNNWYAESCFWNDPKEREKAIEHFEDEYRFSKDKCWQRIYEEWLQYLRHSLKFANTRSINKRKIKREKILLHEE